MIRKQEVNWLFNQEDAKKGIIIFGARNLTVIEAITVESGKEVIRSTYDKMVQFESKIADVYAIEWINEQIEKSKTDNYHYYLYFRFKRYN